MTKADIDYISNIISIAVAKGTPEQIEPDDVIDEILHKGCAQIQSKIMMLEAFKAAAAGNKKLIRDVIEIYDTITEGLGFRIDDK